MRIEAFAKVNLTLEVLGRRSDGYHDLRSIVVPVSLSDTVEIGPSGSIESQSPFPDDLPLKAARLLAAGRALGASIRVTKRIPVGGGLGGGSADAAAALVALNDMWCLGKSREALVELGAEVGSDVPALVHGGPVLMEGRGERVRAFEVPGADFPRLHMVLASPGIHSSTREVYGACSSRVTSDLSILYNMQTALASGDCVRIASAMANDLQTAAVRLYPEIGRALSALGEVGVVGAAVSGSGSTVFGLVPDEARGREAAALLGARGLRAWSVHTVLSRDVMAA